MTDESNTRPDLLRYALEFGRYLPVLLSVAVGLFQALRPSKSSDQPSMDASMMPSLDDSSILDAQFGVLSEVSTSIATNLRLQTKMLIGMMIGQILLMMMMTAMILRW